MIDRRSFLRLSALLPFSIFSVDKVERKQDDLYVVTVPRTISVQQQKQLSDAMRKLDMYGLIIPADVQVEKISRADLKRLYSGIDRILTR